MKSNGCKVNLKPGAETGSGVFSGTAEIPSCPGLSYLASGSCTVTYLPQGGIAASFENVGSGASAAVNVSLSGTGLEYTISGSGCPVGTYKNGTLQGSWNVWAQSAGGGQVNLHTARQNGIFLAGEQSEDPKAQPRFEAEGYPAGIIAPQVTQHVFGTSIGNLKCNGVDLGATVGGASSELGLDPEFRGCRVNASKTTIRTNTCTYALKVANAAGPYSGTLSLACSGSNQLEAEFLGWGGNCTIKIPPQTLASVSYENQGSGASRTVLASMSGTGLKYTLGANCELTPGSYGNGTLSGSTSLGGLL